MDIGTLPTPALVVYRERVEKNVKKMIAISEKFGVKLRPHFKTSKVIEVAVLQTNGSKRGLVVSTIPEASALAENGFDDILYGIPLSKNLDNIIRCKHLNNKLNEFHVMIDDLSMVDVLAEYVKGGAKKWSVFINVDCGYYREGIAWNSNEAFELAKQVDSSHAMTFQGLYTHCGQSYYANDENTVGSIADQVVGRLLSLVKKLEYAGVQCKNYGIGSTPSCSQPTETMKNITEWHPGNYVFFDLQQEMLGSCSREEIACFVLTRVIGRYSKGGRDFLLVDCGWTALTTQGFGKVPSGGYGAVVDHPELKLEQMTQEIGKISRVDGDKIPEEKFPVGSMLSILPYHSCATCCMHPHYYVVDTFGKVTDKWTPVRGW